MLGTTPPDVVLLDLNLPDGTGMGTLRHVLQHSPAVPVVVLTGAGGMEQAIQAVQEGAADYLIKRQINGPLLMRAIRFAVERAARQRATAKIKDAEIRYHTLFEQSPDGIAVYDLRTCLPVEFNSSACQQLGYSSEEFGTLRMCDYCHGKVYPGPGHMTMCASKIVREGGSRREIAYHTKMDEVRHVVVLAQPVAFSEERFLLCIYRDITEEKRARLALQDSQQRFCALVETTSDWIWATDATGVYTYCSPRVRDLLGYEPEEILGRTLYDLVLPDEAGRFQALVDKSKAQGEPLLRLEHVSVHKDGSHVVLETNANPIFDDGGTFLGYRGIDRNITEIRYAYDLLRERENCYRKLFAAVTSYAYSVQVHDGVSVATIHGDGCAAITGYQPRDYQAQPALWYSMIHPDDREMVLGQIARVLAGEQVPPLEHRIFCRDGTIAWVRNTMIPYCDHGHLTHYDGLIEDITERKKAEKALRDKELQLVTAQKIQERFLPAAAPLLPGFEVAGAVHPAEFAAGDYFDYLPIGDGQIGFVIGDVAGHGFGPALIMASTHVMLRLLAETHRDVAEILTLANSVLVNETEADRFVTLLFACLDPGTRTLVYSNAGHPPGYVLDSSGHIRAELAATNIPLGIMPETQFAKGGPVTLEPGDTVVLVSDGILESKSPDGVLFGMDRALDVVRANLHATAAEIVENVCQAARGFWQGEAAFDDMTAMVIKAKSEADML